MPPDIYSFLIWLKSGFTIVPHSLLLRCSYLFASVLAPILSNQKAKPKPPLSNFFYKEKMGGCPPTFHISVIACLMPSAVYVILLRYLFIVFHHQHCADTTMLIPFYVVTISLGVWYGVFLCSEGQVDGVATLCPLAYYVVVLVPLIERAYHILWLIGWHCYFLHMDLINISDPTNRIRVIAAMDSIISVKESP